MAILANGKLQSGFAQPLDLLNEEVIRHVLTCVDKKKLQKNVETGRVERDGLVFETAARYLGFYGEGWIKFDGILYVDYEYLILSEYP